MPKVTFVNEHRTVEVEKGRKISDVAAELGIAVCREADQNQSLSGDFCSCADKGRSANRVSASRFRPPGLRRAKT